MENRQQTQIFADLKVEYNLVNVFEVTFMLLGKIAILVFIITLDISPTYCIFKTNEKLRHWFMA